MCKHLVDGRVVFRPGLDSAIRAGKNYGFHLQPLAVEGDNQRPLGHELSRGMAQSQSIGLCEHPRSIRLERIPGHLDPKISARLGGPLRPTENLQHRT